MDFFPPTKCYGSVITDQSGWGRGFTVKQGATTVHEDSAANTVSAIK